MANFTLTDFEQPRPIETNALPFWNLTADNLKLIPPRSNTFVGYGPESLNAEEYDGSRTQELGLYGSFTYQLDPNSGALTGISGTVSAVVWREAHESYAYWGWKVTGLNLSVADVLPATGPTLEALLFAGDDHIKGSQHDDNLRGLTGGDYLTGMAGADTLAGGADSDWLVGGTGNDVLLGGAGDDLLQGDTGRDTLTGDEGSDVFLLNLIPKASDADVITDFAHGEDKIRLLGSAFNAIGTKLDRAEFYSKAGAKSAHDASDRIIYNPDTGRLYYDKDGRGGAAAILIGTLSNKEAIARSDIQLLTPFRDKAGNSLTRTFSDPTPVPEFYFGDGNDKIVFEPAQPWSGVHVELDMGSGNDSLKASGYSFLVRAGAGNDTIDLDGQFHTISGGDGNDTLTASGNKGRIFGGDGDDVLTGDGQLSGGEGNDKLFGSRDGVVRHPYRRKGRRRLRSD